VSGNTLTVVLTLAGIVFGGVISWWFARAGKRDLQRSFRDLQGSFAAQQSLLVELRQTLQSSRLPDTAAGNVVPPLRSAEPTAATDALVRASLGALLNEHGEVSVPRLLQELARDLPAAAEPSVLSSLEELRKSGRVSWQGDDVRKAGIIKVHP
jgi:hypothetical protein